MDWNSPTTKKHIAEAKAQGCELLGKGKTIYYRSYRLSCGHEQEVQPAKIRHGGFRCQKCLYHKLNSEAATQGCELLRLGGKVATRIYLLPCGHEQEIETAHIRRYKVSCRTCFQEQLRAEAQAQGCELLRPSESRWSRIYRLPCGHEQEVGTTHVREGNFRCKTCLLKRLTAEAKLQGCDLLGTGKDFNYRLYRLPCGHKQEINVARVRDAQFSCRTCIADKQIEEARAHSCELLRLGKGKDYRIYRLPCGHEQEVVIANMRNGNFSCQVCEDWAFTQPSQAYLLHIKVGSDEWLKLGYAKNIDHRITQYGLPSDAEVSVLKTKQFDTGKEAVAFEKSLHKKHKRKRLKVADMAYFHTKSGQTECYPVLMVHRLMAEFRKHNTE